MVLCHGSLLWWDSDNGWDGLKTTLLQAALVPHLQQTFQA